MAAPQITSEDYLAVKPIGIYGRIELVDGVPVMGFQWPVILTLAAQRAAAEIGVALPSLVDAVMADPEAKAEVAARLAAEQSDA